MAQTWRTVRIFISSTFRDMHAERDWLVKVVFPELRERMVEWNLYLVDVDLRRGVSGEAALDQQTMNICIKELKRCQMVSPRPNFIILLGERYGWRPLPPQIEASEFETLLDRVPANQRPLSTRLTSCGRIVSAKEAINERCFY